MTMPQQKIGKKSNLRRTTVYKTQLRKLKTEQHPTRTTSKSEVISNALEGKTDSATQVAPTMLLI